MTRQHQGARFALLDELHPVATSSCPFPAMIERQAQGPPVGQGWLMRHIATIARHQPMIVEIPALTRFCDTSSGSRHVDGIWPPEQLLAASFLAGRPLCSQLLLLKTDDPHVLVSRKADCIVATIDTGRPADAIGYPLRQNAGYRLYRENLSIAGPSACSQRRLDRIYTGRGFSPQ
jgi:hypothetical protein